MLNVLLYIGELIFSFFIIFLTYQIVSAKNVIRSVFALIVLAINFSFFLFFYQVNFLAILYLAVYIGAVAVFFLFVVMMTDLNTPGPDLTNIKDRRTRFIYFSLLMNILGIVIANLIVNLFIITLDENNNRMLIGQRFSYENLDFFNLDVETLGLHLFQEQAAPFIILGLIILIALIGSILITTTIASVEINFTDRLTKKNQLRIFYTKSQDMEIQLARNLSNTINLNKNY